MDVADNADAVRIALVVDRVRKPPDEDATKETMYDGKLLRCFADLVDGHIEFGEKVSRRHFGSIVIPLERLRNLGARLRPDADVRHLSHPRAQFLAESRPRDAGVRIGIGLGLAGIELLRSQGRGERCSGCRIQAIPEPPHEHDPLIDSEQFEGL
jgi:hypothetical protein